MCCLFDLSRKYQWKKKKEKKKEGKKENISGINHKLKKVKSPQSSVSTLMIDVSSIYSSMFFYVTFTPVVLPIKAVERWKPLNNCNQLFIHIALVREELLFMK